MPAFVIVEVQVHDPVRYEDYKLMAAPTIAAYGGRYIVRGGAVQQLEGDWNPGRLVVLEFPTAARAKEWWNCSEYAPAKHLRHETATTRMILVEGL